MVTIATRASWGARRANGDRALTGLATEVFLHHTVTALLPANATVAQERAQMRHLEDIGQNRFGTGISYNVVIFPSGRAYQGVSWNRRGTHTGGRNSTSRSIALAGNFETATPTAAAITTAARILAHGRGRWWTQGAPLRGHSDVSATACPGRNLRARMADIRRAPAAAGTRMWARPGGANARTGPGTNNPVRARIPAGESRVFTVSRMVGNIRWHRTQAGNWVSSVVLTTEAPVRLRAVAGGANARRGPGTNHPIVARIAPRASRVFVGSQMVGNVRWRQTMHGNWVSDVVLERMP